MMVLENKPETTAPESQPTPQHGTGIKQKRSCLHCNTRDGEPFLCSECQWHIYHACEKLNQRIDKLLGEDE